MTANSLLQILFYIFILMMLIKPLSIYMVNIYTDKPSLLNFILKPCENLIYKCSDIDKNQQMSWKKYLISMLWFNFLSILLVYVIQRIQLYFPLNFNHIYGQSPNLSFNTTISFMTNTDWQTYNSEKSINYINQTIALNVQNFTSAATGMSIAITLIRSLTQYETTNLGNFWVDLTRSILYILLPLSIIFAIFLTSQGVIQNFKPSQTINTIDQSITHKTQIIPMGPVASQVAISQLGSNGGGFFNTSTSHPFANPNSLSNFIEMIAICLIPASFFYIFGLMCNDKRQSKAILTTIFIILLPCLMFTIISESKISTMMKQTEIDQQSQPYLYSAGNMEGKETRFSITNSAIWAVLSTATSNGSMNTTLDSFNPLSSLIPLWLMHLGEVVFGGAGTGFAHMLIIIIITVFITGLMVGRTPEYLGKKIEIFEIKMASIAILLMPLTSLLATAFANNLNTNDFTNTGAHGFTSMLYACTSLSNNNGSAFAGLPINNWFYNIIGGIVMLINHYWTMIAIIALAGSLSTKKYIPNNFGTLETHTPLFIILLISIIFLIGALAFLPALSLGPIVEQLILWKQYG